ncbi:MAG TPA: class I SAM-dependent methyltransferase [Tepidiformaceae bacterium]|nr:class I SAM-dependent methyltransferase [Tepidiformaceae bacterium]
MDGYDSEAVRRYFDTLGQGEWERLERDLRGKISYLIHWRLLLAQVKPGVRALDVGCGPGRFALDMLEAGARVTLVDLSPVQLSMAKERVSAAGKEVDDAVLADVCDLGCFPDGAFGLTVAYGGVLSYTRERHGTALDELVRVTVPEGVVLLSVMPLGGTMRLLAPLDAAGFLEEWEGNMEWDLREPPPGFVLTPPGSGEWHQPLALFTARYLKGEFARRGCEVLTVAAASPIATLFPMPKVEASPVASERLIALEVALSDVPELAESGMHMVVVARKSGAAGEGRR